MFLISTSTSLKGLLQISSCGRLALKPFLFLFINQKRILLAKFIVKQKRKVQATNFMANGFNGLISHPDVDDVK